MCMDARIFFKIEKMPVHIAAYTNSIEAHLARRRLEAECVPTFTCHEHHIWGKESASTTRALLPRNRGHRYASGIRPTQVSNTVYRPHIERGATASGFRPRTRNRWD